jgi:glycosyltransferase involved in cell wall biosynthesis
MNLPDSRSVTVVIPTFNRATELKRALESLAAQTDANFKVFVCDDGSTENIATVVAAFSGLLDIEYQRILNSGGPARPRNCGIDFASTEWVSFLDSDDWWLPSRMASVKENLSDAVDVVYHQLKISTASSDTISSARIKTIGTALQYVDATVHMLRIGNPLPTSATTVRVGYMRKIGGFDERRDLSSVEDFDAWLRLAAVGARFKFVPDVLGHYWVGEDNISAFTTKQYERQKSLFEKQLGLLPGNHRRLARNNFSYLLGSYEIALGLPDSGWFNAIEFTVEPVRWLKARLKRARRWSAQFSKHL